MSSESRHAHPPAEPPPPGGWSPADWRARPQAQSIAYPDPAHVARVAARLAALPPLVTSFEVERLRRLIADAQEGRRFLLWGGDCAEAFADCTSGAITRKLKILLQMSVVLVYGGRRPVIRVGRMAGQYAKPRSSLTESRVIDGRSVTLPSYFGDLINRAPFDEISRRPDPELLIEGYHRAAATLNFVRSLVDAGFADAHHPEYWDLGFLQHAGLSPALRDDYRRLLDQIVRGVEFFDAMNEGEWGRGGATAGQAQRVEFFVSHEALHLEYESAQTRRVPRRSGWYNLTTHLPWVGERTRALDGAHIEYLRGLANPVGVKVGPAADPAEIIDLCTRLNPCNEPGKVVLIPRLGAARVREVLPALIEGVQRAGRLVLWVCDPMHANALTTASGMKTRRFADILDELEGALEVHARAGVPLGGVHVELTGDDVTECLGGAGNLTEADLATSYQSACDPRLNYSQAMELALKLAKRLGDRA